MTSEKSVELRLCRRVDELGGIAIKLLPWYLVGLPDRIVLMPGGRVFFTELKRRSGRRRRAQKRWRERLRKLGFYCDFLAGREEVDAFIQHVIDSGTRHEEQE